MRAVIFDFNGTLSDDEPLLAEIFVDMAAELGVPITTDDYWRDFAGLSDPAIVDALLDRAAAGDAAPVADAHAGRAQQRQVLLRRRVEDYKRRVPPVAEDVVALVRSLDVPLAVASGAAREEVEHVLGAAGLLDAFGAIVCAEDVTNGKPAPDGYLLALERLDPSIDPADVLCVEDADKGVASAHAAGMRCAALTSSPAYTGGADVELARLADLRV
jgi:beta-phosphoglucomutase